MEKLLLLALIFAGFEIQHNLALTYPGTVQDCWSKNKCLVDSQCGKLGRCILPPEPGLGHG